MLERHSTDRVVQCPTTIRLASWFMRPHLIATSFQYRQGKIVRTDGGVRTGAMTVTMSNTNAGACALLVDCPDVATRELLTPHLESIEGINDVPDVARKLITLGFEPLVHYDSNARLAAALPEWGDPLP